MAVAAEALTETAPPIQEEYARSLSCIRRMGALAMEASTDFETAGPTEAIAFDNYTSALREMLKTDGEFRDRLDIDDRREHAVSGGMVRDKEGVPMAEVVAKGREISEAAAIWQPELRAQAIRDAGDELIAKRADELKPGESLFTLSMEPKDELRDHRKTYRDLGYRENLSYLQWYSRVDENTLVAGSFSVDMSDETAWREMFADLNVAVPEGESPNTWIQHTLTREMTAEQAEQFVQDIRHEYYQRRGVMEERQSVGEYVQANGAVVQGYFDAYYPALAKAVYSGENNRTLQDLAGSILKTDVKNLKPEIRQQLLQVSNGRKFDDELGKTMDSVIRYAVVEELRAGMAEFVSGRQPAGQEIYDLVVAERNENIPDMSVEALHLRLANNVEAGVQARRSYGGCSNVELSDEDGDVDANGNPQEAYGGSSSRERRSSKKARINCIKCRQPTTIGEVDQKDKGTWRCPHCKYEVDVCTGDVKNHSEKPKKAPKPAAEKPAETRLAPVIELEAKRREKQETAARNIKLGDTVQPPGQPSIL
jgi:ribosomal protein L37AE/L43A